MREVLDSLVAQVASRVPRRRADAQRGVPQPVPDESRRCASQRHPCDARCRHAWITSLALAGPVPTKIAAKKGVSGEILSRRLAWKKAGPSMQGSRCAASFAFRG